MDNNIESFEKTKCDRVDYLVSAGCGVVGGLVDVFLVGSPGDSPLGSWTDKQVDNVVKRFAKVNGWSPKEAQKDNVKSAIGFLERKFKINYDQSVSDSASAVGLTPRNHHMKSLAHSPDIIGLFFSILNQFTSTSTFLSDGRLITMDTDTFELHGGTFVSKFFCGFFNWFGHLMSDFAGSSGAHGRGAGIVIPFYELFQLFDFGKFKVEDNRLTLAELAEKVYENGYDARFAITMSIPVVITDLTIRLIWSLRRLIQYKAPLKECIPFNKYDDLRMMILIGNGTLCSIDLAGAAAKSGGTWVGFAVNLNLVAWVKMVRISIREAFYLAQGPDIDMLIEENERVQHLLSDYIEDLKKIDIDAFEKETTEYEEWCSSFDKINDKKELNDFLLETYDKFNINLPWQGDFDEFMSDSDNTLVFE